MRIILINGPPYSGKDTLAQEIVRVAPGYRLEKFSKPLKEGGAAALGIPLEVLETTYKGDNAPVVPGLGRTWRDYQISMSEDWYKPVFGDDIFGRLLAARIDREETPWWVVSDSGFTGEAMYLYEHFGPGVVYGIRVHRHGCDFSKDSRDWLSKGLPFPIRDIRNDKTPGDMLDEVQQLLP